ncbi:MAG: sulfatase-like hydrolase/transferase [Gemmatimonadales bacterium]|jgi:arylsulfatase A-like enzyme|nr:sulfatase-like hydrolase/transferase [Gemmatimonadales bacterium]
MQSHAAAFRSLPPFVLALFVLVGLPGAAAAQDHNDRLADHVVLISVDGLRPEFYLEERWPAPMMQRIASEGTHATKVRGVTPTVTYPSHTTLVTGALPARHGVTNNRPFEPGGESGLWFMESSQILVPTLWDAVKAAGGTSAGISWPVSAGSVIDFNIPEFWSVPGREGDLTGPAASTAALRSRVTPPGLLEEIENESLGPFSDRYWGRSRSREDMVGDMAAHIIEAKRPNLLVVHLNQTDYHQHAEGREHPEVRLAVAAVDRAIARMVEAADRAGILERTAFIVTGDHGFVDVDTRVAPNVWLVAAGLHEDRPDRGDWRAAFHSAGGSAFLRVRDPSDHDAVNEVRAMLEALQPGVRSLFRVVEREELAARGADPESPLALAAAPGVSIIGDTHGLAVRSGSGGAHGYFPEMDDIHTGFAAWGAGIAPGRTVPLMGLVDVAPVIAALLGLDFYAPDGVLRPGILAGGG